MDIGAHAALKPFVDIAPIQQKTADGLLEFADFLARIPHRALGEPSVVAHILCDGYLLPRFQLDNLGTEVHRMAWATFRSQMRDKVRKEEFRKWEACGDVIFAEPPRTSAQHAAALTAAWRASGQRNLPRLMTASQIQAPPIHLAVSDLLPNEPIPLQA